MNESMSIKGRIMIHASCTICNKDKGFVRRSDLGRPCKSCSTSMTKKGKPSPKKGVKTGKPAWNKGLRFSQIPKEHKILKSRMKTALNIRLKAHNGSKAYQSTFDILCYSVQELKLHLESKFQPGMSWENRDKWHIDHIKPDSLFCYSSTQDEEFKKCWALENLQPLWAKDNISKGNRFMEGN